MSKTVCSLLIGAAALAAVLVLAQPRTAEGQSDEEGFKNLQVLPGDIARDDLRNLMQAQARALGVRCTHCHVRGDFASEDNPNKAIARQMMRMTRALGSGPLEGQGVGCGSCHAGDLKPSDDAEVRAALADADGDALSALLAGVLTDEKLTAGTRAWMGLSSDATPADGD
jgi:hypothetical protein